MDMFEQCEILTEKLKQNGFENHFVTLWNNEQRVKKYLLCDYIVPFYSFVDRMKIKHLYVSSTPESMDDFIDLMVLQKGDGE